MKTERRHELQTNDLANLLGKNLHEYGPMLKQLIAVAIIGIVAFFAYSMMKSRSERNQQISWTEYFEAAALQDLEGLAEIAQRYPNSKAGAWALQSSGDINLATGSQNMFSDRAEAREQLLKAKENFEESHQRAQDDLLKQRSLLGSAQAMEGLNEFDEAAGTYQKVIDTWPGSALAEIASDRLLVLNNPETREFYDWFVQQQPRTPIDPLRDIPIKTPGAYDDLPTDPSLSLPAEDELLESRGLVPPEQSTASPVNDTPVPEAPGEGETMRDGGDFPAETSPADPSAADSTPADSTQAEPANTDGQ